MTDKVSGRKIVIRCIEAAVFLGLFLFLPAGTLKWAEAWVLIIIYLAWAGFVLRWLNKYNPALLEKRLSTKLSPKRWDRVFTIVSTFLYLVMFITYGLDAVRFGWSEVPVIIEAIAFPGVALCLYVVFLVMKENAFLARVVEIQEGQKVISTGPYGVVRHPMYAAFILMTYCMSLALGSLYSLIPATLIAIAIIVRTVLEDKTLHQELSGYAEYAAKVKYRLVPGVW